MNLRTFFEKIYMHMYISTEDAKPFFPAYAVIAIGFGAYYVLWRDVVAQPYESFTIRFIAVVISLGLLFTKFFPKKLQVIIPFYWYGVLVYTLPFFFTFMLLKNGAHTLWPMNSMVAVVFLVLLTDWISFIGVMAIGILAAWSLYYYTTPLPRLPDDLSGLLATYIPVLLAGSFFVYKKDKIKKTMLKSMGDVSSTVAHELRTPLAAIIQNATGLKDYFSDLLVAYKLAQEHNLPVKKIRNNYLDHMGSALDDIVSEANYANEMIKILLVKSNYLIIDEKEFKTCSINFCIEETLRRYPFLEGEKNLIVWNKGQDFLFNGTELLTIHILFNLLKNALFYIKAAQKGQIFIRTEVDSDYNRLYFKDTGQGISSFILPRIFEWFYSNTHHGSGIGLAFCKSVMQKYGGDIQCESVANSFAEFILFFPKFKD